MTEAETALCAACNQWYPIDHGHRCQVAADNELAALTECVRQLNTLESHVQARVLLYLARRFNAVVPTRAAPLYQFAYDKEVVSTEPRTP